MADKCRERTLSVRLELRLRNVRYLGTVGTGGAGGPPLACFRSKSKSSVMALVL